MSARAEEGDDLELDTLVLTIRAIQGLEPDEQRRVAEYLFARFAMAGNDIARRFAPPNAPMTD